MKKIIIALFVLIGITIFSQKIYIGDLVNLSIEGKNITKNQIEEKFKGFEIEKLVKKDNGYELSIRSFETGTHNISIGNTDLEIIVESVIEEKDKSDPNKILDVTEKGQIEIDLLKSPLPITYFLIGIAIFIFMIIILIILKFCKSRKHNRESSFQRFINQIRNIESEEYFFELTKIFKEYIYNRYKIKISGKTSKEILKEVPGQIDKEKLKAWLDFADLCKFGGLVPTPEEKELYKNMLVEIIQKSEEEIFEVE
ncbi:MAG: hypothetical protein ACQERZ_00825 [Fusobacteriota bacterium]